VKLYQAGGWRLWRRRARGGVAGLKSRGVAVEPLDGRVLFATTGLAASVAADVSPIALAAPVNVSRSAGYQGEGSIAVDPTNPSRVFTTSETDAGGILAAYSTDGGATWTTRAIANGNEKLPRGDKNPQAVFDAFGNLYVSYLETTAQRAIKVVTSSDGGVNFAPLYTLAAPGIDQPSIAAGGDSAGAGGANVWITYRNGTGGISASGLRSTGLGTARIAVFSSPQTVPGATGNFGDIAVGPSGEVVVTWQTNTGGEGPAQIQVSTDADGLGPGGFSAPVTASNTNVGGFDFLPSQPARAIDAEANLAYDLSAGSRRGRLYLVYTDESPDESNDFDVFVRASNDNGATWGAPIRVNDDPTTRSQFLPDVAVDPTSGTLAVGWYDARDDGGMLGSGSTDATANNDVRYWGAVSGDGGVSFQNVPVAAGVSNAAAAGGLSDFGDYSAVAAYGGRAYFGWADNSPELSGNPNRPQMDWAVASGAVSAQAGPRVVAATPAGDTFSAVDHIDFTYDRPMDPSTYSLTDVVSFTGPSGAIKSAITTGTWLDGNRTLRLSFVPQSTPGVYTLALGADIRSVAGDKSDNNVNGVAGEVPQDRYNLSFTITPPRVTASAPASPKVGTAGNFDFTFNQPMDPASFAVADDLVSFTGPGGVDLRPAVTGFSWLDGNRTLRVNFDKQGGDGLYAMTIGPSVLAAAAPKWAMDQDGDFTPGEAGADAYTATLTIDRATGPDSFGYKAWTNAALSLDLSPTGAGVSTAVDNTDDGTAQVPLGTNTFNFYGRTYTGSNALFVGSNGLITFGGGETSFQNGDLSDAPSRATISPLWDDWRTDVGTDSRVLYRFDDTDGDGTPDRLVVEWNSVPASAGSSTNPATFQALLQLNTNGTPGEIIFNYPDLDVGAASLNNGAGATVGIRDAAGNGDGRRLAVAVNVTTGP
jgi:hypothetical protein